MIRIDEYECSGMVQKVVTRESPGGHEMVTRGSARGQAMITSGSPGISQGSPGVQWRVTRRAGGQPGVNRGSVEGHHGISQGVIGILSYDPCTILVSNFLSI